MSTNNKVFQVLVTKGNAAPLAKDLTLDSLQPGQIGIFNASTNLSIDATSPAVKNFYIAVGVDKNGDGTVDDMNFSAGQVIQKENVRDYTFRPHTPGAPQIFEITNYDKVECETDYTLRFEIRNMIVYMRQGYNQYTKAFSVRTSCCDCSSACPSGSAVELTKLLFHALKADKSGMFKVEAITPADAVTGQRTVIADIDAYAANAANADKVPGLRITVNGIAVNKFCNINTRYYNPRQTVIIPSLVSGFGCTGVVTTTQQAVSEEGNGYDIKQKEYHAGGWNGRPGPYRASTVVGLAKDEFMYFADETVKYDQVNLVYDLFSTAGWGEYLNNLQTLIAVPQADTVTRNGLVTVLDAVLNGQGFEALADDATSAVANPATIEKTSAKGADKDGLAS